MRVCVHRFRLREDDGVRLWPAVESEDFGPVPLPDRVLRNISVPDFVVPLYQYDLLWQRQLLRALRVSSLTASLPPAHRRLAPHLHPDSTIAAVASSCARTRFMVGLIALSAMGRAAATSAPGLGSPLPTSAP